MRITLDRDSGKECQEDGKWFFFLPLKDTTTVRKWLQVGSWENDVAQTLRVRAPQSNMLTATHSSSTSYSTFLVEVSFVIRPHNHLIIYYDYWLKGVQKTGVEPLQLHYVLGTFSKWQSSESPFPELIFLAIQLIREIQLLLDFSPTCGRGMWQATLLDSLSLFINYC